MKKAELLYFLDNGVPPPIIQNIVRKVNQPRLKNIEFKDVLDLGDYPIKRNKLEYVNIPPPPPPIIEEKKEEVQREEHESPIQFEVEGVFTKGDVITGRKVGSIIPIGVPETRIRYRHRSILTLERAWQQSL